jgi:hypothetical protein
MRRMFVLFLTVAAVPAFGAAFKPKCDAVPIALPHPTVFERRSGVDTGDCGVIGEPEDNAHKLQNTAKNNLCAAGDRTEVTDVTLVALQEATASITDVPTSRTKLPHRTTTNGDEVGEGSLVMMRGWLLRAKGTSPESVNCQASDVAHTDIHLAISQDPTETNECFSNTAEMIPHYRPADWSPSAFHFLAKLKPKKKNKNDTIEYTDYDTDARPPVRVTGQLFFDASHTVCDGATPLKGQPARFSNWEIHPVYNIEVCMAANADDCDIDNDDVWENFTTWNQQH